MNFAEITIKKRVFFLVLTICIIGIGTLSYQKLGRLEDPEYTIKKAIVVTQYPGATPLEVEQEVTDPLETAIQQLGQLNEITSFSRTGLSFIFVEIKDQFNKDDLPQICLPVLNHLLLTMILVMFMESSTLSQVMGTHIKR